MGSLIDSHRCHKQVAGPQNQTLTKSIYAPFIVRDARAYLDAWVKNQHYCFIKHLCESSRGGALEQLKKDLSLFPKSSQISGDVNMHIVTPDPKAMTGECHATAADGDKFVKRHIHPLLIKLGLSHLKVNSVSRYLIHVIIE